jgi:acyl phosphate:glycerol-3-phosphate acyltransferase
MLTTTLPFLYCIISYLFGSLCTAIIVCRVFGFPDPRTEGSHNPGATNVLRLAGKKYAIMVLIGDMLKGFLPVFSLLTECRHKHARLYLSCCRTRASVPCFF